MNLILNAGNRLEIEARTDRHGEKVDLVFARVRTPATIRPLLLRGVEKVEVLNVAEAFDVLARELREWAEGGS